VRPRRALPRGVLAPQIGQSRGAPRSAARNLAGDPCGSAMHRTTGRQTTARPRRSLRRLIDRCKWMRLKSAALGGGVLSARRHSCQHDGPAYGRPSLRPRTDRGQTTPRHGITRAPTVVGLPDVWPRCFQIDCSWSARAEAGTRRSRLQSIARVWPSVTAGRSFPKS